MQDYVEIKEAEIQRLLKENKSLYQQISVLKQDLENKTLKLEELERRFSLDSFKNI